MGKLVEMVELVESVESVKVVEIVEMVHPVRYLCFYIDIIRFILRSSSFVVLRRMDTTENGQLVGIKKEI
ncbi:MAG: hypothetical protein U9R23_03080 [Candidatus Cloacimonadota bacterium]|nr:hypothetical protein [Candidatus Cloacimonadota bacterium]